MNQLDQRRRGAQAFANSPYGNGAVVPYHQPGGTPGPVAQYRDVVSRFPRAGGGLDGQMGCFGGGLGLGRGSGRDYGYGHGHGHARDHGYGHGNGRDYGHGQGQHPGQGQERDYGHGRGQGLGQRYPISIPYTFPKGNVGKERDVADGRGRSDMDRAHEHRASATTSSLFDFAPAGNNREHSRFGQRRDGQFDSLTDARRELPPYREGGDAKALNPDLAVVRVVEWLSSEAGKKDAIRALDTARAYVRQERPHWESVPFALWATMDNGLFKGRLSPAVYLEWAHPREYDADAIGRTFAPGKLETRKAGTVERIGIQLNLGFFNARAFPRSDGRDAQSSSGKGHASTNGEAGDLLIAALIHQMVHAWFLRACGQQKKATQADHRLKHADGFWKMMHTIAELSRQTQVDKHAGDAPRFADTLIRVLHKPLRDGEAWQMPHAVQSLMNTEHFDHTVCHACMVDRRTKEEADAWYKKVAGAAKEATSDNVYAFDPDTCDIKATPRHEKGSPITYIEVVWDKKPFDYKRKGVEKDFSSIKARLADGKRVITLPRGVDAATFRVLDTFLKSGSDYKPALSVPVQAGIPLLAPPFKKPPKPDPLWLDVRAFKLGTALELPELAEAAMARLHSQRTIQSSPIEALEEIYASPSLTQAYPHNGGKSNATCSALDSSSPNDALRAWARRLMLATKPSSADGGYYASNLYAIDRHCGGAGVQGLVASSQSMELEQDHRLCLTQLLDRTPKSMHPPGGVRSGGGVPWTHELPARHSAGPNTKLAAENSDIRHQLRKIKRENEELRWGNERRNERRRSRDRYPPAERRPWSYYSSEADSDDDLDSLAKALEVMERLARREGWSRSEIDERARKIEWDHRHGRREPSYRR